MSSQASLFELLPNELIDQIVRNLSSDPPSPIRFDHPPNSCIVRSARRDLKNLSRTSSRFLDVIRPRLFAHSCFDLNDAEGFLKFIKDWDLGRCVTSIVVRGHVSPDSEDDPFWWRRVLHELNPRRITLLAPPSFIGATLGTSIMDGHNWAFQIPLQALQLEQEEPQETPSSSQVEACSSLLSARTWSSLLFNEASSLKAYNHYEYFLFQVPSVFNRWGSLAPVRNHPEGVPLSLSLNKLTSFRYTAVFPFYNHVKLVLDAVTLMTNLRSLSVQLAPCSDDKVIELEQRGSMDPSDPWMELATGYTLIAHAVRDMGSRAKLLCFCASDYTCDALRPELSTILGDVLDHSEWVHDGYGTWTKGTKGTKLKLGGL
ncbi:F-box domain protein [Aspergillus clavatus NRRL 1]|uniref:F-box domain protein n=1 Tax=Aspergillus clavatus (strain ATCC 1007 / CBS 513.65 / DSM 816 / NCTC 3887 / NRRL 1 / QM 1276 / 107) TaxID=344612 RepID=A1CKV2_ASPCL|nr:F-box domain protein [Aspergillus clavatus NRRL 1]EAW09776.1 F-box domain protein [Aspergillus clavatus NRRL 1]